MGWGGHIHIKRGGGRELVSYPCLERKGGGGTDGKNQIQGRGITFLMLEKTGRGGREQGIEGKKGRWSKRKKTHLLSY